MKTIFILLFPILAYSQTFTPKIVVFHLQSITLIDSTAKQMPLFALQSYLKSDSAVIISMKHFRAQNDQLSKMTRQIIDQDTTIRSQAIENMKLNQVIANDKLTISEKDGQLNDKQSIIDGADQRLKNCQHSGWKRTGLGIGLGFLGGVLGTTVIVVSVR